MFCFNYHKSGLFNNTVILLLIAVVLSRCTNNTVHYIPTQFWPEFDKKAPYTINGPLWVGYDSNKQKWKYLKISFNEKISDEQRGLKDPGDPDKWTSDMGQTGYFAGNLNELPSGTHINNKFNPSTVAFKYQVDDIMIKVGNFWVDKYESSIVQITNDTIFIDDPKYGGVDSLHKSKTGTAFDVAPYVIAVSQRRRATSGITYFVAEQAAVNNGKHIIRNEQWQASASGTTRTNAEGMLSGGEDWKTVTQQDISRYGVVGCAGSLWEWTSSWGQYGEHYSGSATNWYDWPGPESHKEWDDKYDTYGNDIIINMAGRAYTRQDSARYAAGLPAALVRGGSWGDKNRAGIFALIADGAPSYYGFEVGFRCAK
jgi:hypothetical protein